MEPLTPLMSTLGEAAYGVRREGGRVVFAPAPPPEHRPLLAAWKAALPHALEEGERIPARELLRLERLACILLAAQGEPPPLTWATFYYENRHEPERVLAPQENLLPHLRWRARNLPEPRRLHLGATDASFLLDLEAPLEAFLRMEGKTLELYAWPEERMREYLWAAAKGRAPQQAALEWRGQTYQGTWEELAEELALEKVHLPGQGAPVAYRLRDASLYGEDVPKPQESPSSSQKVLEHPPVPKPSPVPKPDLRVELEVEL